MVTITGTLAKYYNGGSLSSNSSMFTTDSRQDLMNARSSFIRMLNVIFARTQIVIDKPEAVTALSLATPISEYLFWRGKSGSKQVEMIPPTSEWNVEVFSLEERDSLLTDAWFLAQILAGNSPRVLVNGIGNPDQPQWSVYEANIPNGHTDPIYIGSHPQLVFSLAKSYDFEVNTMLDRNNLLIVPAISIGQRVLVKANSITYGFWTIWQYVGTDPYDSTIDANGFKLVRCQTYNTDDFWNYTDWYATGYVSTSPPVVTYDTQKDRDSTENPNPTTPFVKITNDGTGSWIWTAYINGVWNIVARQNGTISFSSKFYDLSRPVFGITPVTLSILPNIPNRDGSLELKALFNMLQDNALLFDLEINEIFFSMIHFIHAQQDQVAWAFKTSFLNIGGYNEAITQTPVEPIDNTINLTNYIEEIKPYRVKIRDFTQIISPPLDNAVVHVTDFDFPQYYDSNLGTYRTLDLINDIDIISSTAPWSDWYNGYLNSGLDINNYAPSTWNPVRHFNMTLRYDRVDHMPVVFSQQFAYTTSGQFANNATFALNTSYDISTKFVEVFVDNERTTSYIANANTKTVSITASLKDGDQILVKLLDNLTANLAADRITRFYDPTNETLAEDNLRTLMGMNFNGTIVDGTTYSDNASRDFDIDGNALSNVSTVYKGTQFIDPVSSGRPEELMCLTAVESLSMFVQVSGEDGDPDYSDQWVISMARPDTMAPKETGDFDARPLDDVIYDVGALKGQALNNAGVETNIFVIKSDAYEFMRWGANGNTLATDILANTTEIVVTLANAGVMPFNVPVVQKLMTGDVANSAMTIPPTDTVDVITEPGVVWVNGERIEFYDYAITNSNTTVTLSQIKRGTHNTRICNEQLTRVSYVGNSIANTFVLSNQSDASDVTVVVNEQLKYANGAAIIVDGYSGYAVSVPKTINVDYSIIHNGSDLQIVFVKPPASGSTIYITKNLGLLHPSGSTVNDGRSKIDIRPDIQFSGMVHY